MKTTNQHKKSDKGLLRNCSNCIYEHIRYGQEGICCVLKRSRCVWSWLKAAAKRPMTSFIEGWSKFKTDCRNTYYFLTWRYNHEQKLAQLRRQHRPKVQQPKTVKRAWWILGAGVISAVVLALLAHMVPMESDKMTEPLLKRIFADGFLKRIVAFLKDGKGSITLLSLIIASPVAYAVLLFRDSNKLHEIENTRKDTNLKEFQQLQQWATGNITDTKASEEERLSLQVSAAHQLRPYLRGEFGKTFQRPAFELYRQMLAIRGKALSALHQPAKDLYLATHFAKQYSSEALIQRFQQFLEGQKDFSMGRALTWLKEFELVDLQTLERQIQALLSQSDLSKDEKKDIGGLIKQWFQHELEKLILLQNFVKNWPAHQENPLKTSEAVIQLEQFINETKASSNHPFNDKYEQAFKPLWNLAYREQYEESVERQKQQIDTQAPLFDALEAIAKEEWFALLVDHDFPLTGINLSYIAFPEGIYLANSDLRQAQFEGSSLAQADLRFAKLSESKWFGSNLRGVKLTGANLIAATFCWNDLRDAQLQGVSWQGVSFISNGFSAFNSESKSFLGSLCDPRAMFEAYKNFSSSLIDSETSDLPQSMVISMAREEKLSRPVKWASFRTQAEKRLISKVIKDAKLLGRPLSFGGKIWAFLGLVILSLLLLYLVVWPAKLSTVMESYALMENYWLKLSISIIAAITVLLVAALCVKMWQISRLLIEGYLGVICLMLCIFSFAIIIFTKDVEFLWVIVLLPLYWYAVRFIWKQLIQNAVTEDFSKEAEDNGKYEQVGEFIKRIKTKPRKRKCLKTKQETPPEEGLPPKQSGWESDCLIDLCEKHVLPKCKW